MPFFLRRHSAVADAPSLQLSGSYASLEQMVFPIGLRSIGLASSNTPSSWRCRAGPLLEVHTVHTYSCFFVAECACWSSAVFDFFYITTSLSVELSMNTGVRVCCETIAPNCACCCLLFTSPTCFEMSRTSLRGAALPQGSGPEMWVCCFFPYFSLRNAERSKNSHFATFQPILCDRRH